MTEEEKHYKECLKELLIGLECEHVDHFVGLCSPKSCRSFGELMTAVIKSQKPLNNL